MEVTVTAVPPPLHLMLVGCMMADVWRKKVLHTEQVSKGHLCTRKPDKIG